MKDKRMVLTRQGFDDMQRELDEILKAKRPAMVKRIHEAIKLGDLSENFDYQDAKRQQGMMEGRIRELKIILSGASIIECADGNGCIGIGSTVTIKDLEEGFEDEYMIVGPLEANPSDGKISHESSVGSSLMGCKMGDVITVETPGGEIRYEVVSVQ